MATARPPAPLSSRTPRGLVLARRAFALAPWLLVAGLALRRGRPQPAPQPGMSRQDVAEPAALAAAGPGARLLGPRALSSDRMATCAIAKKET